MTPEEKDDLVYAIGQTLGFYGKELDRAQLSFWLTALSGRSVPAVKRALLEYVKVGRFAPKPAQIIELMGVGREQAETLPPPEPRPCPPEIAQAWLWFMGRTTQGSNLEGLFQADGEVDTATQEKYLLIVNQEAHCAGQPDAVPDEYKLGSVWQ
jgi:hypothetical protein